MNGSCLQVQTHRKDTKNILPTKFRTFRTLAFWGSIALGSDIFRLQHLVPFILGPFRSSEPEENPVRNQLPSYPSDRTPFISPHLPHTHPSSSPLPLLPLPISIPFASSLPPPAPPWCPSLTLRVPRRPGIRRLLLCQVRAIARHVLAGARQLRGTLIAAPSPVGGSWRGRGSR